MAAVITVAVPVLVGAHPAAAQPVPVPPSPDVPPGVPTVDGLLSGLEQIIAQATGAADATPGQDPGVSQTDSIPLDAQTSYQANSSFAGGRIQATVDVDFANGAHTAHGTAVIDGPLCPKHGGLVDPEVRLNILDSDTTLSKTEFTISLTIRANNRATLAGKPMATVTPSGAKGAARNLVNGIAQKVATEAEKLWQSGYCVQIAVDGSNPRHVEPGAHVDLTGKVTARLGGSVPGDVTAKLSGKTKVEPASQPAPDLKLAYEAPSKRGDSASLTLRSVSNRGVGETVLELTTSSIFIVSGLLYVSARSITGYLELSEVRLAPVKGGSGVARGEGNVNSHLEVPVPCPTSMDTKETLKLEARPIAPAKKGEPPMYRLTAVGGANLGGVLTVTSGGCQPPQSIIDPGELAFANSVIGAAAPIVFTEEGGEIAVSSPNISGGTLVIKPEK